MRAPMVGSGHVDIFKEVGVRGLFLGTIFILACTFAAHAQDFGVIGPNEFFTGLDAKGQPIWQITVQNELRKRGFSAAQAEKFSKLGLLFEEDKTKSTFMMESLPIRYNPETGAKLPPDPIKFAAGLPDCFKTDERDCEMKFSVNVGTNVPGPKHSKSKDDVTVEPCMLPERTRQFCRRVGYKNRQKGETRAAGLNCGESERIGWECGADQVVFDAGGETTKLKLAFDIEEKNASTVGRAPSAPRSFAKIVYVVTKNGKFRREGPAELEEWEPTKSDLACGITVAASAACMQTQRESKAYRYCWPHDIARRGACTIP
jgi:hypothetical protein